MAANATQGFRRGGVKIEYGTFAVSAGPGLSEGGGSGSGGGRGGAAAGAGGDGKGAGAAAGMTGGVTAFCSRLATSAAL